MIALLLPLFCNSQNRGNIWTFGHYAAIDFNSSQPAADSSKVRSRGSCVSISDVSGNLLFYAFTRAGVFGNSALIYDRTHQQMLNGDNILGEGWYHELVIIPQPGSDSLYYLFCIGVTGISTPGIFYSKINLSANGGLGAVIQKNVQLPNYSRMVDCLTAVKHGNGRDWWIIFRQVTIPPITPNNEFHSYLVTPAGISNYAVQTIGSLNATDIGNISFNSDGSQFVFVNFRGLIELYDFDRCTGIISNPVTVYTESSGPPWPAYWGAAFSPSNRFLYVTRIPLTVTDTSRLYQFDVTAANIAASADTLHETFFNETMAHIKLAPDGKLYLTTNYYQIFPYSDSTYNTTNMHLSTINAPDNQGATCDFQPYSFYLGGKRTYLGLPNNPDYHLGPKIGSGCDTLTALNEHSQNIVISSLLPNPNNGEFTVNYFLPNGNRGVLEVFGSTDQKVYQMALPNHTYRQDIDIRTFLPGFYVLRIQSGDKSLIKKFVKL